jgi:hypothetical protein
VKHAYQTVCHLLKFAHVSSLHWQRDWGHLLHHQRWVSGLLNGAGQGVCDRDHIGCTEIPEARRSLFRASAEGCTVFRIGHDKGATFYIINGACRGFNKINMAVAICLGFVLKQAYQSPHTCLVLNSMVAIIDQLQPTFVIPQALRSCPSLRASRRANCARSSCYHTIQVLHPTL